MTGHPLRAPVRSPVIDADGLSRPWREWFDSLRGAFASSVDMMRDAEAMAASEHGQAGAGAEDILGRMADLERDIAAMTGPAPDASAIRFSQDGTAVASGDAIDCQGLILAEPAGTGTGVSIRLREPMFADGDIVSAEDEYVWSDE